MKPHKISLQINLSAADLPVCRQLLERQIRFWYDELDEIVLSIESKKSFGKFATDFDQNQAGLLSLVEHYEELYPKVRHHFIDYSPERKSRLAALFFDDRLIPEKDYRGCAFYSYLDGLASCRNRYIIHIDSDMMIGGAPNAWLQDAVDLLNSDNSYLLVNPLAGPPAPDNEIRQTYLRKAGSYRFLFEKMSTRVFLIDMDKLNRSKLTLKKAPVSPRYIKWFFKSGYRWGYMALEDLFSEMMVRRGLLRVDTLGLNEQRSAYSLHPLVKPKSYIQAIPDLLRRMDANDIPDSQRGNYNINNDFFDFESVK
jgi:hypothetical protein